MASSKSDTAETAEGASAEDGAKKGMSPLILGAIALVAAAGAGAGAFVLSPAPSADKVGEDHAAGHSDEKKSKDEKPKKEKKEKKEKKDKHASKDDKKKSDKDGEPGALADVKILEVGDKAYVEFPPLVVSIRPVGRARHLKISIVIETTSADAEVLKYQTYTLNDVLNTYLRSISAERIQNPAMMEELKEQIEYRIQLVAPDITITNTLVTEFLLS